MGIHVVGILAVIAIVVALFLPLYYLILVDLTWVYFFGSWSLGGVRFNPTDVTLAAIAGAVILRGKREPEDPDRKIPYLGWIAALTVLFCLSYVTADVNKENLTDPVRISYQLYRYNLKPLLYFPLCVIFLRTPQQRMAALTAIVVGADLCAIHAIFQGYDGVAATGPFRYANGLAGVLVMPFTLALAGFLFPRNRFHKVFSLISFLLMGRAFLFTGSRGGIVAAAAGVMAFVAILMFIPPGRRRVMRLVPKVALVCLLVLIAKPDVFQRPTVQKVLTLSQGTKVANFQWRTTKRWPHFWKRAWEKPWLGHGTAVDSALGRGAGSTPHNGYLAIANTYGFPAAILLFSFFFRTHRDAFVLVRRAEIARSRLFGATVIGSLTGFMVHNLAEVTLTVPDFNMKVVWVYAAIVTVAARRLRFEEAELAPEARRTAAAPHPALATGW